MTKLILKSFYVFCLPKNFPLSLYNNVTYHIGDFFCLSLNSSFTHKPGMTAYFYYLNMSPSIVGLFPGNPSCHSHSADSLPVYVWQVLQEKNFLLITQKERSQASCWQQVTTKTGTRGSCMLLSACLGSRQ